MEGGKYECSLNDIVLILQLSAHRPKLYSFSGVLVSWGTRGTWAVNCVVDSSTEASSYYDICWVM